MQLIKSFQSKLKKKNQICFFVEQLQCLNGKSTFKIAKGMHKIKRRKVL